MTEVLKEVSRQPVDQLSIGLLKNCIALFGLVPQRFNDVQIEPLIAGNEFPKPLPTEFEIIPLIRMVVTAISTAVNGYDCTYPCILPQAPDGLLKVAFHALDLAGVTPVRAGFDRDKVVSALALEFQINALSSGFVPSKSLLAHENRQTLQKFTKKCLFL